MPGQVSALWPQLSGSGCGGAGVLCIPSPCVPSLPGNSLDPSPPVYHVLVSGRRAVWASVLIQLVDSVLIFRTEELGPQKEVHILVS